MNIFIFTTTFVQNISHSKKNEDDTIKKIYIGLHVKCPLCSSILTELEFSRHISEKS
jgi:hypothetical protein